MKVQLTAPPVDGEANRALIELFASELGVRKADVEIVRGETGRSKTVRVALGGTDAAWVEQRLAGSRGIG